MWNDQLIELAKALFDPEVTPADFERMLDDAELDTKGDAETVIGECVECGEAITNDEPAGQVVTFVHTPQTGDPRLIRPRIVTPHLVGDLRAMIDGLQDHDIVQLEIMLG